MVANGQYVFPDKATLETGVAAWIADETTATATYGDINTWGVAQVISMQGLFHSSSNFNSDISNWDVSSVTNMGYMFFQASAFNSDISRWNVSSVTTMEQMLGGAQISAIGMLEE